MAEDLSQIEAIFHEALAKLPGPARAGYLDQACAGNAELRQRVEALLASHEQAEGFLALPTLPCDAPREAQIQEKPGTIVGRYKLLQQIGEGGFGVVFMAEQEEPVRRRVALKVIKLGMDTHQVVARFEAERQALAMMDHPGIARVFDGGATETGRPYFVMELVKGVPIVEYCDHNNLDLPTRLDLFVQVCQAVQHAHQKGLIHRDLKPSNVLVSTQDDRPVAKVIDFGIAKATQSRLTEKTLFTEFRQLIGTPEYMSPEQASGSLDIDTRSDVYSLGALLYELLTGGLPFDAKELRSKAFEEMQRIIREVDPPTPSNRLSTLQTLASVAALRKTEPGKLCRSVRGELDWIVMKCLEKNRARRYESASALAGDVMNHLADEPILAGAPSKLYRLRKFARRHRGAVAAAAVVSLVLLAGTIGTSIGLLREARQRRITEQQRNLAEQRQIESQQHEREAKAQAAIASAVGKFQADMLASADPERMLGDKVTVLQVLSAAIKELDDGKLKNQPLVEASVRETIGNTLRSLGTHEQAETQLRRSIELRRKADPTNLSTAEALQGLGIVLTLSHKLDDAERTFHEALTIRQAANDPLQAASLRGLAGVHRERGNYAAAQPLLKHAMEGYRASFPPGDPNIGECANDLGLLLLYQSRFAEAEPLLQEALRISQSHLPRGHPMIATNLNNLALIAMSQQRIGDAQQIYEEVLAMCREVYPADHPATSQALDNMAEALWTLGKFEQAAAAARESLQMRLRLLGPNALDVAMSKAHLAFVLRDMGEVDEADKLAVEALQQCRLILPPAAPEIANVLAVLAELRMMRGNLVEAESCAHESLEIYRKLTPQGHPGIAAFNRLGAILLERKKYEQAERLYRESLEAVAKNPKQDQPGGIIARFGHGLALAGLARHAEAESTLLQAEQLLANVPDPPPSAREKWRQCVAALVKLYTAWDQAEPGKGYDAKASLWRAKQASTRPATQSMP